MATSRTGTSEWKRIRRQALKQAQANGITHCRWCGVELDYTTGLKRESAVPDHLESWASTRSNHGPIEVICRRCNESKGDRDRPKTATTLAIRPLKTSRQW